MSRVYVVEAPPLKFDYTVMEKRPKFDVSPARRFGDVIEVFRNDASDFPVYQELLDEARETMKGFDKGDYILPTGDPVLIGICTLVAAELLPENESLQFLKWDRRERDYVPASFIID
jgi:hypothetical protein